MGLEKVEFDRAKFEQTLRNLMESNRIREERQAEEKRQKLEQLKREHHPVNLILPIGYEIIGKNANIINRVKADLLAEKDFHYMFFGEVGCGKTYLATIVMQHTERYFRHKLDKLHFITIKPRNYIEEYLRNIKRNTETDIESYWDNELLLIDDLGAEKNTDFPHSEISFRLEDHYDRIKSGGCHCSIITTNLPIQDDEDEKNLDTLQNYYGDRCLDRLLEFYVPVFFHAKSYRTDNKTDRVN